MRLNSLAFVGNLFCGRSKSRPVAIDVLQGDQLGSQVEPHPFVLKGIPGLQLLSQGVRTLIRFDHHGDPGGVVEGLFMPEHDRLPADLKRSHPGTDCHGPDGRRGSLGQLLPGLVGHIGTGVKFRLSCGEVHSKSQTGGNAAFTTVRLG